MYVAFEGIDGSGKSTQHKLACQALEAEGLPVEQIVEPTRGEHGLALRRYIAENPDWKARDVSQELKLFMLDREQLMQERVLPALRANRLVLSDRTYFSSVAYQGTRLNPRRILLANERIAAKPDLVLFFDISVEDALKRVGSRGDSDGFEHAELLEKVRGIYMWLSGKGPGAPSYNVAILDARLPIEELAATVLETIKKTTWTTAG